MKRRATIVVATLAAVFLLVGTAAGAGPDAYQVLTSTKAPRSRSAFTGVALTVFVEGRRASGYRSVAFKCTRGTVKLKNRTLRLPVHVITLRQNPDLGGQVESLSTCTWLIRPGLAGKRLTAGYAIDLVNADGTTASEGGPLAWTIR